MLVLFGAACEAFAIESSRSAHYVSLKIVKSSELLCERVALFTDEVSLFLKQFRFAQGVKWALCTHGVLPLINNRLG